MPWYFFSSDVSVDQSETVCDECVVRLGKEKNENGKPAIFSSQEICIWRSHEAMLNENEKCIQAVGAKL